MASLTRFCLMRPDTPITFLLSLSYQYLKPKHLLIAVWLEIYGFIFSELTNASSIAHSVLGGMCGVFLSTSFGSTLVLPKFSFKLQKSKARNAKSVVTVSDYIIDREVSSDLEIQVDKILDKINEKGFGSLTEDEKSLLEKAKSLFNSKS